MGRRSTTGGVTPAGDRIQLYFRFRGQKCRPQLDMKPTAPNLAHGARLVRDIEERIRQGRFEYKDLAREFPTYKGLARFAPPDAAPASSPKTFRQYGELWLGTKGKLSPSTLRGYDGVLKAHWYPWFGERPIALVLHSEVAARLGELPGSRKTHNNVLDPGRQVFALAKKDGAIASNPCDGIDYLELPDPDPEPFDLSEVEIVLAKMRERFGEEMHDYFEWAFFSGMRPSEQIEHRWDDTDLRERYTRIARARVESVVKDTKTYYNRTLEHHSRAHAALLRQYARTGLAGGYVWLSPFSGNGRKRGEPWLNEHSQSDMFRTVMKLLRLRARPAKNTRHTYATVLLMAGAKPAWAAAQLGHSLDMFLRRYTRWIPGADRGEELAKVEAFTGQSTGQSGGKGRFKAA